MFEALLTICLDLSEGPCRDQLLPGYEAPTAVECAAHLAARPPSLGGLTVRGAPFCAPRGPALDVEEIAPGVFVHVGDIAEPEADNRGDVSNFGFVIGPQAVAVIDSGAARWLGEAAWRAIRARTDKPVTHLILTHMHPDHVLGASAFVDGGAQVVAHANMARSLADRQSNYRQSLSRLIGPAAFLGSRVVPVDLPVPDAVVIDLGGRELELRAWPAAHTSNDLTVLDGESGTLFAGDLVFQRHTPALDGTVLGWQAVLAEMQNMQVARVVPGHGLAALSWPDGAEDLRRYLEVLTRDTRAAIAQGHRLGEAVQSIARDEAPHWDLFETYNPRNATQAFTELEWE